jgi:hypothetical protein
VAISGDMPGDFRLTSLEKFTKYTVVVQAVNSIGEGPNSDPFSVLTLEDGGCSFIYSRDVKSNHDFGVFQFQARRPWT